MSLSTPWTSAQLGSELGLGASYTSGQVGSAIGTGAAFTSAQAAAFTPYTPPSANASTSGISKIFNEGQSTSSITLTTSNSVTANVSNGVGPFSYSWFISGGDSSITINSPSSATTSCSATLASNTSKQSYIECQVTDSHGTKCWTGQVSVFFELDNTL